MAAYGSPTERGGVASDADGCAFVTLGRVLDILEAFDEDHRRMTLSEISNRVGLARTTCLRLLQSLEAGGI